MIFLNRIFTFRQTFKDTYRTSLIFSTLSTLGLTMLLVLGFFGCGEDVTNPMKGSSQDRATQAAYMVSSLKAANDAKSAETADAVDKYMTAQDARRASDSKKPARMAPPQEDDENGEVLAIIDVKLNADGSVTLIKSDGSTAKVKFSVDGSMIVENSSGTKSKVIVKDADEVIVSDIRGTATVKFQNKNKAEVTFENGQTFSINAAAGKIEVTTDTGITLEVKIHRNGKFTIKTKEKETDMDKEVEAQVDGSFHVRPAANANAHAQAATQVSLELGHGLIEVKGHAKGRGNEEEGTKALVESKGEGQITVKHETKAEKEIKQEVKIEVKDKDTVKVEMKEETKKGEAKAEAKSEAIIEIRSGNNFEVHFKDGTTARVEANVDGSFTVTTSDGTKTKIELDLD